jgi:hypothetical protein
MARVGVRFVQELMGYPTITMNMGYAHLSPAHLLAAVNTASLGATAEKTGSGTGSNEVRPIVSKNGECSETPDNLVGSVGGAERVRTAASQFCRLLPYHLGTAPREGCIIAMPVLVTQLKPQLE